MRRRFDDAGVSTVIGAIIVLAIIGLAVVSINGYAVPRQGNTLEVEARDDAEASLIDLGDMLGVTQTAPFSVDLALRAASPPPPLLAGLILSPAQAEGRIAFEPSDVNLTISHVMDAPAAGVPGADPMREDIGSGLMRVFLVGNATAGQPVGAVQLAIGGVYLDAATYRLELGGLLVSRTNDSESLSLPSLSVAAGGTPSDPTTSVAWRIPILTGAASESTGGPGARLKLAPGPLAEGSGGQRVHNVTIRIETNALSGWNTTMHALVGTHGTVTTVETGPDAGVVTATILPPAGTPAGTKAVELSLSAIRYHVELVARAG